MRLKITAIALALAVVAVLAGWPVAATCHEVKQQDGAEVKKIDPTPELVAKGEDIFKDNCANCHFSNMAHKKVGPGLKGLFKHKKIKSMKHPVNEAGIREHIKKGGPIMPAFDDLKPAELDALIAYLKTL